MNSEQTEKRILALLEASNGKGMTQTEIGAALQQEGLRSRVYEMWKRGELMRAAEKQTYMCGNSMGSHLRYRYFAPEYFAP